MRWNTTCGRTLLALFVLGSWAGGGRSARAEDDLRLADAEALADGDEDKARAEEQKARAEDDKERAEEEKARIEEMESAYDEGRAHLDDEQYDRAIAAFDRARSQRSRRADGALYWKAYAQNRKGQRAEALASLTELRKLFPKSRWLDDAKALELEMRPGSGQRVAEAGAGGDEDLKLMALNGLMNSDPERAVPLLEKFLTGNPSRKLQDRALFVLAQSDSPRAREIVARTARGGGNPDVQRKAIQYLALFGGQESKQTLADIFKASSDSAVKKAVLQGFMVSGEKARVLEAARGESDADVRRSAIQLLGAMGAHAEIWELYRAEQAPENKKALLQAMFVGGDSQRLLEVARTDKDESMRRAAVRNLGLMGGERTGKTLLEIYRADPPLREAVLEGFFLQGNVQSLISIAREEKDPRLRKEAVQKLSLMHSKEATDFMLELLEKD
jgi:HEAT repeat protein